MKQNISLFILFILLNVLSLTIKGNPGDTVDIEVDFALIDIRDLDDDDQTMYIDFIVRFTWLDFEPHIDITEESHDDRWLPHIQIINDYGLVEKGGRLKSDSNGKIYYTRRYIGKVSEKMNFEDFPFDEQQFEIDVIVTSSRIGNMILNEGEFGEFGKLSIPGWKIKQGNIIPLDLHLSLGEYPAFRVYFEGKRRSGFYLLKIFLPIALIVLMSWTVFWVDPSKSEAQLTVSATSMLSLVAFLFSLSYFIPKLDYLTNLDIYLYGSMVFVFFALAEAALTSNLSSHRKLALARKIDIYARIIFPGAYLILILIIFIT